MSFKVVKRSPHSRARYGILQTPHGQIETPAFTPVATQAALKGLAPQDAKNLGTQVLIINTYHLWVRRVVDVIKSTGGVHRFMNWQGPTMTDSGGFQVFSLGAGYNKQVSKLMDEVSLKRKHKENTKRGLITINEKGITFRSHLDGTKMLLTPKVSIGLQEKIGADIIFALDECTSPTDSYEYNKAALARTHAWADKSLKAKTRKDQLLFGIVQGGRFKDLRQESAKTIGSLPFDGFGIGGGFGKNDLLPILEWTIPLLPEKKPRHYLGIGAQIKDITESVRCGVDTFDCVEPTRLARHGVLITAKKRIIITHSRYKNDKKPIDSSCKCLTCAQFTRAYLHHVFAAKEMLAATLANIHNIYTYNKLFEQIRENIKENRM